ncbi:bifunctional DNA-formamidopyrimidine glycosylase/DNA-(apurinic or apyrimidinic site) lyase [Enterovibrio paralichthyis]|uniref:bifunctional DNA-formamidopyrimidine glycosylase/DNA-(apurinic or apyrimidinic site) lyase n=1 Tax=Enterovibrio paralichthyis TaxID=2853805 RepID=UPI001C47FD73|nr:bifunctional DNA-formamidopyrimidine glycosylase/DNA-(apurinic or apyrimidinic site) lyase [Enterovibrio paralichthyis]MBV7298726.1 bifunctional DNA-formamidopyrimidine glycosylase/DNA-(apurinic or apyrimidinic site) lyase [Enterovibrio paralichthyis]
MPELPEVEVSRLGIQPHALGQVVTRIDVRQPSLRWPVPENIHDMEGQEIRAVKRRAKYLILETDAGEALIHLGMSGSLRVLDGDVPPAKHDHVDLHLSNGKMIRYNDPRRFGAWLWQPKGGEHAVLGKLGPEPLTDDFTGEYLFDKSRGKRTAIKQFIMDNAVVVGVGNIYANESLFICNIHPKRPAGQLTLNDANLLVDEIKQVLATAIKQGGTTLKDFTQTDGKPGYFAQELLVYGKQGKPCPVCGEILQSVKIGQRNTVFCPECQKD